MKIENLEKRAEMLGRIRTYFDRSGFIEVETPVRIAAPAPEVHIDCPASGRAFLRASPELEMKRLLASGMKKIYQIGPCFREGECGSKHQPEFTMLEWYRANASCNEIMEDAKNIVSDILPGKAGNFSVITVSEAYRKFAGWDPLENWNQEKFDVDMAVKIEPSLGEGAVFLVDYPVQAASLAAVNPVDPRTASRWELYIDGIEIANAFTELTDPAVQRERFELARNERRANGEADYPMPEKFLEDLAFMPPSGGAALGIDRLAMLACSEKDISAVRTFSAKPGECV